jgi:hypothetical protein
VGWRDLLKQLRVPFEDAQDHIAQIPQQVESVSNLNGLRRTESRALSVLTAAGATDYVSAWMGV